MRHPVKSETAESDQVLTTTCSYLGSIAPDLRMAVAAQCPGCRGEGACVVREAIRALAAEPTAAPVTDTTCACRQSTEQ